MLKIKKSLSLSLPSLGVNASKPMQLSPISSDEDELVRAVDADPDDHDDNWELNDRPDTAELEQFWTSVEEDVRKDPTWFTFDD